MNLCQRLKEINREYSLNKDTKLKVICIDGEVVTGFYDGYVSASDNEYEIPEIDIISDKYKTGITTIFENEIENIEVIK